MLRSTLVRFAHAHQGKRPALKGTSSHTMRPSPFPHQPEATFFIYFSSAEACMAKDKSREFHSRPLKAGDILSRPGSKRSWQDTLPRAYQYELFSDYLKPYLVANPCKKYQAGEEEIQRSSDLELEKTLDNYMIVGRSRYTVKQLNTRFASCSSFRGTCPRKSPMTSCRPMTSSPTRECSSRPGNSRTVAPLLADLQMVPWITWLPELLRYMIAWRINVNHVDIIVHYRTHLYHF